MDIKEAEILLIEMLSQPQEARFDFLNAKRREVEYSEQGFYSLIKTAFENWYKLVQQENYKHNTKDSGGLVADSLRIPLLHYTDMKFEGHLGFNELEAIKHEVEKLNPVPFINKNEYCLRITDDPNFKAPTFKYFERSFKLNGYSFKIGQHKIYSPHLAHILTSKEVKAFNRVAQKNETFNGQSYLAKYKEGYSNGIAYFNKAYPKIEELIHSAQAEALVRTLHEKYFHSGKSKALSTGWNWVKEQYPTVIDESTIKEQGYYSGIAARVEELKENYPSIFDKYRFDECINEQPEPSQQPEPLEKELSEKIRKHFGFMLGRCPRKGVNILNNEEDFERLVNWTAYFYENNFEVPKIEAPISSVNTNVYITQLAFMYLFDELRKAGYHNQRSRVKALFILWESCFADYKGYSEKNFWKVNQSNRQEVKKLMLISQ